MPTRETDRSEAVAALDPQSYVAPLAPDGTRCYWCDPNNGPCRIHGEALDLLNSLGIAGPNIIHAEQGMYPDGKHSEDDTWDGPGWCVCRRTWPCEAKRLGDLLAALRPEKEEAGLREALQGLADAILDYQLPLDLEAASTARYVEGRSVTIENPDPDIDTPHSALRAAYLVARAVLAAPSVAGERLDLDTFVSDTFTALRRRLVGTPPNVDSIDAAIGYALNDCEAAVRAALGAEPARPTAEGRCTCGEARFVVGGHLADCPQYHGLLRPEKEEAGLDVERLARATAAASGAMTLDYHREWASKVAAEYARLAEAEAET